MAILAECPICHRKQSIRNKHCAGCSENLDRQKRNGNARFWITYRLAGRQRKEFVGHSIEEARDAEGKRRGQRREGRIFEILPQSQITFTDLTKWYQSNLESDVELTEAARARGKNRKGITRSYLDRVKSSLSKFNEVFGDTLAAEITEEAVKRYCAGRERTISPYSLDVEISIIRTMINEAFDADKVGGPVLKVFRRIKTIATTEDKTRKRALSIQEAKQLLETAPPYLRAMLVVALHTGMRLSEIRLLNWSHIDRKAGMIRLPGEITKTKRARSVPLTAPVLTELESLPRHLHGFVITYNGHPLSSIGAVRHSMRSTCKLAGVAYGRMAEGGIIFHDTRRTAKTNMVKAGVNKVYRDLILGHSLQGMDAHYISEPGLEDELRQAGIIYSGWLQAQIESVAQSVAHINFN